jgi:hypothetical protein
LNCSQPGCAHLAALVDLLPSLFARLRLCASISGMRSARLMLAFAVLLCACPPPQSALDKEAARSVGPLVELLPPGPSPIVIVRPRLLFQHEAVRSLWTTLVEPEQERTFVERTGVDLRDLEELVVFELPASGYVLLVRGPFSAREVVERAAQRLTLRDVEVDEPRVRREGLSGATRYAYAALDAHSVLASKNAPPLLIAAILTRIADRALPRPFDAPDPAALYKPLRDASCVLFAPKPLELDADQGVSLLLAEERALSASAVPEDGAIRVDVALRGEFPPAAEQNFERLVIGVAHSPLGQLLGLAEIESDLKIVRTAAGVDIAFRWPAQRLALGLRALFKDDLRDLMR